jgi:transcription antitermination factor NusG
LTRGWGVVYGGYPSLAMRWRLGLGWAVVQAQPGREVVAVRFSEMQGYECYWPRVRERGRTKGLFPRYFFAWIEDRWWPLKSTCGVSSLIVNGEGRPYQLGDDVIDAIKRMEQEGVVVLPKAEGRRFKRGERVVVRDRWHVLGGRELLVEGMKGADRVRVLFSWFGSKHSHVLDAKLLRVA